MQWRHKKQESEVKGHYTSKYNVFFYIVKFCCKMLVIQEIYLLAYREFLKLFF